MPKKTLTEEQKRINIEAVLQVDVEMQLPPGTGMPWWLFVSELIDSNGESISPFMKSIGSSNNAIYRNRREQGNIDAEVIFKLVGGKNNPLNLSEDARRLVANKAGHDLRRLNMTANDVVSDAPDNESFSTLMYSLRHSMRPSNTDAPDTYGYSLREICDGLIERLSKVGFNEAALRKIVTTHYIGALGEGKRKPEETFTRESKDSPLAPGSAAPYHYFILALAEIFDLSKENRQKLERAENVIKKLNTKAGKTFSALRSADGETIYYREIEDGRESTPGTGIDHTLLLRINNGNTEHPTVATVRAIGEFFHHCYGGRHRNLINDFIVAATGNGITQQYSGLEEITLDTEAMIRRGLDENWPAEELFYKTLDAAGIDKASTRSTEISTAAGKHPDYLKNFRFGQRMDSKVAEQVFVVVSAAVDSGQIDPALREPFIEAVTRENNQSKHTTQLQSETLAKATRERIKQVRQDLTPKTPEESVESRIKQGSGRNPSSAPL